MVVEQSVRSPNNALAILRRIPGQSNSWSDIVEVSRNALANPKRILSEGGDGIERTECGRELDVIADAVVKR